MNSPVRIIKRGRNGLLTGGSASQDKKAGRRSTREIVGTVKGWIAELHQRRREEELAGYQFKKLQ
ncbi:MAG: hypothetical protein ACRD6N_15300 [Pyrinomonadaceae bacterium]